MPATWNELRERARRAEQEEGRLEFLRGEAARLTGLVERLRDALASEARDVDELESLSLDALLARWLGTAEERLARERREWLEARARLERARDELADVSARAAQLEATAGERRAARAELATAAGARRAEIAARGGADSRRVAELDERMDARAARRLGLDAALATCAEARSELAAAVEALDEGRSHAAADLLAVGYHAERTAAEGKLAGVGRAHAHAARAAAALRRLEGEPACRGVRVELDLALPTGWSVADWWLDGLLSDWLTQRRLREARERTVRALTTVDALALRLRTARDEAAADLARDERLLAERLGR